MINQEVKGTLAKLLATENLTVEHRKVSTACFDVEKRLLILPIWKTASNNVYDLLVGHEVGHALYTPNEDFGDAPKAFVNVLEDARIERMMKVTYPGLKKSFFVGYNELWDDDFFGIKGEKLDTLSLIDRINLYFKGNPNIPFTDEEKVWVERTSKTVTFEDVVQLAIELYEYACKKQEEKEYEAESVETNPDGESFADDYEQVTPEDSGDDEKEWPTESDPEKDHRADRNADDADLETPSYVAGSQIGGEVDETECITDTALQDSLQNLIDENAKEWVYLTLPKVDVDQCIVPVDKIQADLNYHFYEGELADDETREGLEKIFKKYPDRLEEWTHSYYEHQKEFFKEFSESRWTTFRYGKEEKDLVSFFKENMSKLVDNSQGGYKDVTRSYESWNPSDIWAVYDNDKVNDDIEEKLNPEGRTLTELNNLLMGLMHDKKLIGISLKKIKSGNADFKYVNTTKHKNILKVEEYKMRDINFDIKLENEYSNVNFGSTKNHQISVGPLKNGNLAFNIIIKGSGGMGGQAPTKMVMKLLNESTSSGITFKNDHNKYPKKFSEYSDDSDKYEKMYNKLPITNKNYALFEKKLKELYD